ncbi:MAG TPA: hypothetical protein VFG04_04850 [Planctomycetaceae bacterium]|nr:hypothetical protein [Planctomycetaceae bacterium]
MSTAADHVTGPNERAASKPAPSAPRRSRGRTWLLRGLALLVAWGLAELISFVALLFLAGGMAGSWRELNNTAALQMDFDDPLAAEDSVHPYFGFVRRPKEPPDPAALPINGFGFVDSKSPIQHREKGKVIVGMLGGSLAEEFCESSLPEFEAQLRKFPRFADKEFVFVRLAISGYKQPQQMLVVNYLLALGAQFDLIVNIDGFNELALPVVENAPAGVFPSFPRDWGVRVLERRDTALLRRMGEVVYLQETDRAWARRFAALPWCYSPTARLVWSVRHEWLSRAILAGYRSTIDLREKHRSFTAQGPSESFADLPALLKHCVGVWKRSSLELAKVCDGVGIEYYDFLQPNQYLPGSKPMGNDERSMTVEEKYPARAAVETGYPMLIEAGRELSAAGVRFHDLTQIFAHETQPTYRDNCCHLNPTGNELLAVAMAKAIGAKP